MIGNDIVDISLFGSPACQHVRHLDRVCTPEEARGVRKSTNPSISMAVVWAVKEASYKLFSKESGYFHFVPRQFVTEINEPVLTDGGRLTVTYDNTPADVQVSITKNWVHAVAVRTENRNVGWRVRKIDRSGTSEPIDESRAARLLAAELLLQFCGDNFALNFAEKIPTVTKQSDEHTGIGISLSHHGAFAAAAIAWRDDIFSNDTVLEGLCSTSTA